MRHYLSIFAVVFLLVGCAVKQNKPPTIAGEWHFSHINRGPSMFGEFPPPPQFDTITITPPNIINLKASLMQWDFYGTYLQSGQNLIYEFQPPDVNKPVEHNVTYSLKDRGTALFLTQNNTELVYYRPERFYPYEISGEWTQEFKGKQITMKLGHKGQYLLVEDNIPGHYTLWPSKYGKTMSASIFVPGHGGYFTMWKYDLQNEKLTITPISPKGLELAGQSTWERKM